MGHFVPGVQEPRCHHLHDDCVHRCPVLAHGRVCVWVAAVEEFDLDGWVFVHVDAFDQWTCRSVLRTHSLIKLKKKTKKKKKKKKKNVAQKKKKKKKKKS